jgi:nicotinamide phosphoribosyltransferase
MLERIDVIALLAPKTTDKKYTVEDQLKISLICRTDSYKFSHPFAYPAGIKGMTAYGEARVPAYQIIVPFGLQLLLKRYLSQRITMADVDAAAAFSIAHFGKQLFHRAGWEKVVNVYNGYLPLIIRAVPEGTPIHGGQPLYTVTCLDEDLFWLAAGVETLIQRGVWYPTTIATLDHEIKAEIRRFYEISGADMGLLPFSLHDFGGRGVTCAEQAEIGGAAHLVHFMGSDTVEGILTANFYYNEPMSAFSVFATEHAIECSWGSGKDEAVQYIAHQLRTAKARGLSIVSIVIDGFDVYREAELICTVLRDEIIASGVKVVFRPDSGDMLEVVPRLLRLQETAFGYELTAKGYKRIKYVGIIQGDGVDHMAIKTLLGNILAMNYSADCVIFGSGGALLQKVNRDTFKFAQKACSILVEEVVPGERCEWVEPDEVVLRWRGISKNPITDPGKKSKEGLLTLVRSKMTGELMTARLDQGPLNEEFEDVHQLVYHTGEFFNETALSEVRERSAA